MKRILILICFFIALASVAIAATETQTFPTSAGPVKITPLYHASTLIEAGGKTIYLDPTKPAKFSGLPKADLILITDIHGDHMDPDSIKQISKPETEIFAPPAVVQTVTTAKPIANGETKIWQAWTIEAIAAYNIKRGPEAGKLFLQQLGFQPDAVACALHDGMAGRGFAAHEQRYPKHALVADHGDFRRRTVLHDV